MPQEVSYNLSETDQSRSLFWNEEQYMVHTNILKLCFVLQINIGQDLELNL